MTIRTFFLILIGYLFWLVPVSGQISVEALPASYKWKTDREIPAIILQNTEVESQTRQEKWPAIAGHTIPFNSTIQDSGKWEAIPDGIFVWRLEIQVRGAQGLNLYLKDLSLSLGEMLFIYDPEKTKTLGAFTSQNNSDFFPTEFIPGDQLIIELNTHDASEEIPFELFEIGVSAKPVADQQRGFGDAGLCEVKINCPEGENWQTEKRGVARILVKEGSTLFWCSGSLVNNTLQDATPYFLTAKHCGENSTQIDYLSWLFYFNYESTDCEYPAIEPQNQSLEGASLLANSVNSSNSGSDFKLLLLKQDVPQDYKPYFNGWDRSGNAASQGVCIHHPEGDIKMISTYKQPLLSTQYNNPNFDPNGKYWQVEWAETTSGHGVTEGGSSGSPLFSPEGLVVGALSGGRASCNSPQLPDYYGKFSFSWEDSGSDSIRQLKPWLDPIDSGVEKLRGFDPDTTNFKASFTSNTTQVRVGESVLFFNQSEGDIDSYEWFFEGGTPEASELESPPTIQYQSAGEYDVSLIAKSESKKDTLIRTAYIRVLPTLSPNPSSGKFYINFGQELPDEIDIYITDVTGRHINGFIYSESENSLTIDLSEQKSGIYFIRLETDGSQELLKAMVVSQSSTP